MRSRAQFKGHPIHPALIPFPFAFLTGSLFFDAIGITIGAPSLLTTAAWLQIAGVAAGLLAAVPGAVDYFYTVPPESSGRARATRHALGNVLAIVLFALAWLSRNAEWEPRLLTFALEVPAAALLAYAASLGGTLVTRNMISVDHRYAQAGKWQEATIDAGSGETIVVGHADDLKAGQMKLLHVNGRRIVLARTARGFTAFDDRCTHRGGSLAGGVLIDDTVQCLWHGSQFDAGNGHVSCGPATKPIRAYEVREKKGQLLLVQRQE